MSEALLSTIRSLPDSPGIYQYFDTQGRLLYVGKAKRLRARVKSYWRFTPGLHPNPELGPRLQKMLAETSALEYILVESEEDALILENSLIKQLHPKYNILLRDDKTYPYLYLDEGVDFPRFELTRKVIPGKKIRYYGPFPTGARALLDALYFLYPLVQKAGCLRGKTACLFHQIGRCPAPCEGKISPQAYRRTIEEAKHSLQNLSLLTRKLEDRMLRLAQEERFEEAAKARDQIAAISQLKIHSGIDLARQENLDILAIVSGEERGVLLRLFLREGRIVASSHSFFGDLEFFDQEEAYRQALLSYYGPETPRTAEGVILAHSLAGREEIERTLREILGWPLKLLDPRRGPKARLKELALTNAEELLKQRKETTQETRAQEIRKLFGLERLPQRIEVFDNSHLMGEAPVGAMVVWDTDKWDKTSYRRYRLESRDEYHQMMEMLQRRIKEFDQESPPDLWLLDGGETLRRLAEELLRDAGVNLPVLAIAKEKIDAKAHRAKGAARDLLHGPDGEIRLDPNDPRLQWLQRLRDEAHRFAIAYHRRRKRTNDKKISLLEKKGIGPATVRRLLDYFGSFEAIEKATEEDLRHAAGERIARLLRSTS